MSTLHVAYCPPIWNSSNSMGPRCSGLLTLPPHSPMIQHGIHFLPMPPFPPSSFSKFSQNPTVPPAPVYKNAPTNLNRPPPSCCLVPDVARTQNSLENNQNLLKIHHEPLKKEPNSETQEIDCDPSEILVAAVADGIRPEFQRSFKLPASKSPVMEAMVYCALHKMAIEIVENDLQTQRIVFKVKDFNEYFQLSSAICSKHAPSEDIRSRMKALQRWFVTFPAKHELHVPFELVVKNKQFKKVREIIKKVSKIQKIYR